jgi:hypothetical protein
MWHLLQRLDRARKLTSTILSCILLTGKNSCTKALEGAVKCAWRRRNVRAEMGIECQLRESLHSYGTFTGVVYDPNDRYPGSRAFPGHQGQFFDAESPKWFITNVSK